jgi:SAM-dependent methyltransferase
MPIGADGISGHKITREEFDLLGFIDSRYFVHSATSRFKEWKSSFDSSHPDWLQRAEVQDRLASLCGDALKRSGSENTPRRLRILFTGAALGSVATYFHTARLHEAGVLDRVDIDICDLLEEPLDRTKTGDFEFTEETARLAGLAHLMSPESYKRLLRTAHTWQANAVDLSSAKDGTYDVVVAPYLHHHLNFADKALACSELNRVTKPGGFCAVGDLTFKYEAFCTWLQKHSSEDVPYALECFIPREAHEAMFSGCKRVASFDGEFYYATVMRKHE